MNSPWTEHDASQEKNSVLTLFTLRELLHILPEHFTTHYKRKSQQKLQLCLAILQFSEWELSPRALTKSGWQQ